MRQALARGIFGFAIAGMFFTSCSEPSNDEKYREKEEEACRAAIVQDRYAIVMKSGEVEEIQASSMQSLVTDVIDPLRDQIDFVEPVYRVIRPMQSEPDVVYTEFVEEWGYFGIGASYADERRYRGKGVRVAVIDTGVDVFHPQLRYQIDINDSEDPQQGGRADVDDDGNGYVDDVYGWNFIASSPNLNDETGHGTHVAGIIAADPRYGEVKGVASEVSIIPVDFMNSDGGTSTDAIKAVEYALSRKAKIINASWTTEQCSLALEQAFSRWETKDVLFVTAAGNLGQDLDTTPAFPPSFRTVNQLSVGAIDTLGNITEFSNYGEVVPVYAPGDYIRSLEPTMSGRLTGFRKGTSMSAAFVSAQAALLFSLNPGLSPAQVRSLIIRSATREGSVNGAPRIRVDRSIRLLGF